MSSPPQSLEIIGIHPVVPSTDELSAAVNIMYGEGLSGKGLAEAERGVREHFARLFLLEIEVEPEEVEIDWSAITQSIDDQPRDNWQVPWDERRVGDSGNRWAFFLHHVQPQRPLMTPLGDRKLPDPTPIPRHLEHIVYDVPG